MDTGYRTIVHYLHGPCGIAYGYDHLYRNGH